ncbi:MAG: uracil-DNA glycosylase [Planctomycetes bacterium]|nr:uracil-DNA glycosylase [Planctomycetota bacterium]MCH9724097.1 uracil-DNA glycosylase [Planctomycetota bacterium]MCH9778153.1 uracil-DNA glycosylase [Planctomycetota bacterium]MCH9791843.1 uracil-DNA glycosylase [Planctomycetota bacterium]MDF1743458.1 uracil-DNA glycosylase [Gimesia sp.]
MNQNANNRSQRAARQLLESWQRSGITHLKRVVPDPKLVTQDEPEPETPSERTILPVSRDVQTVAKPEILTQQTVVPTKEDSTEPDDSQKEMGVPRTTKSNLVKADRQAELDIIADQVAQCKKCPELASTRTQTVFGVGNPKAKIMFVGEAPGADEDKQGEPFVGRAGKLLDKIIEACQMKRSEIYIANILRCRPPGNRNPSDEEAANCRGFLDAQIEIVDPDYIVCWGSVAAKNLLHSDLPIGKMRGQFYDYGRARVLCTYHPSYLLRNPSAKKNVWEDMIYLFQDMGIELKSS